MLLFFYGFLLISVKEEFWKTVEHYRRYFLYCGLVGFALFLTIILNFEDSIYVHFIEALVKVFNLWSWILTLFGYAAKYLNKASKPLSYANEAVYPFYILHQTIIIIIGFYIMDLDWGIVPKLTVMVTFTFLITWIIYDFGIRRWKIIRPLFGLKLKKKF